jgi:methionine synthase I (cobalamin-dependent)/5,10-methylenetetrahydrofolate reductase
MTTILDRIAASPLVFDGAMGTVIYNRGVFINTCYDELCLTRPDLVSAIHREYVEAGAEVIETNTFGANRIKLRHHGLADRVVAINQAAVKLARATLDPDVLLAGSVGPCLSMSQKWMTNKSEEIEAAFEEQIQALAAAGVDLIQLETFVHIEELQLAATVAHRTGIPVLACFSVRSGRETTLGSRVESFATILNADPHVDLIGINCGVGPAQIYEAAERILPLLSKPLICLPNAGLPRDVEGRMIYLSSPEYFTEYAKKLIQLGARGIGGCCGTTPDHIGMAVKAVKTLSGVKRHKHIKVFHPEKASVSVLPAPEKSQFASRLLSGQKVTSIELLPPKACDVTGLVEKARQCKACGIDVINIPDGPRASARVSPLVASIAILQQAGIEPVLHYCCRDRNLIGMQSDLLGAHVAGVRNILIITGDPPKLGDYPDVTGVFDVDSIGLTQVATNLNHGRDIGGNIVNPPTALFLGVGANPTSVSLDQEFQRYAAKLEAGAEFAITQPVFDPETLFRFLDRIESLPRRIPVIAGVWPLISFKNAEFMKNEVPGVTIPDSVMERMAQCKTKEEGIEAGIEIARTICEAISERVAGWQVSAPLGKLDIALRVLGKSAPV